MRSRVDLRRSMRDRRRALAPDERRACAHRLAHTLAASALFRSSRRIACYLAVDGELDPASIMAQAFRMRKDVYLPVLSPYAPSRLQFAHYRPGDPLAPNRFGIPEPRVHPRELIGGGELDLVLAPLVAFDASGNRLGMGGGFYDRTFAFLRHRRHWRKPRLVGLAYEFQRVAKLPREPWDVPMSGIATDRGLYFVP